MAATALENGTSRKRHTSPAISRKKSRRNTQERNPEQPEPEFCSFGIGELEKVSEALGLRRNFLNKVKSIPDDDIFCHKGLKGFVPIFIERKYFDIEEESLKEKLSEELLEKVGFTDSKVINNIMTRSKKMGQHLDPIDFIKRFVKDEFKYDPTLIDYAAPEDVAIPSDTEVFDFADYRNDEQNEHCEELGLTDSGVIYAKKVGYRRFFDCIKLKYKPNLNEYVPKAEAISFRHFLDYGNDEQNEHCEVIRLFHGTDLYSSIDIMKKGIEIDFGRHKHDFSDGGGFYLTTFEHAETWARSQTRRPVVLELKIPKTCFERARTLKLDVSKKEGRSEWDRIVSQHRSGRPSKKLRQQMKEYDCIEGPISVPFQDPESYKTRFKPEPGSYQLCVVKRRFAEEIEKNAKYTLYTDPEA